MRLGCNGYEEVMSHTFFKGMNWDKLLKCQVEPPFRPQVEKNPTNKAIQYEPTQGKSFPNIEAFTYVDTKIN